MMCHYFLGVPLPQTVSDELVRVKKRLQEISGAKTALNSPPHITLVPPFFCRDIEIIHHLIKEECLKRESCELALGEVESFARHAIAYKIIPVEEISELQAALFKLVAQHCALEEQKRPFYPHVSLAYRDIPETHFDQLLEISRTHAMTARFQCESVSLFEKTQSGWQCRLLFPLKKSQ